MTAARTIEWRKQSHGHWIARSDSPRYTAAACEYECDGRHGWSVSDGVNKTAGGASDTFERAKCAAERAIRKMIGEIRP